MFPLARFSLRLIRLWRMRVRVRVHSLHVALTSVPSQRERKQKGEVVGIAAL
jgi:hypothetical protein